jgi:nucleoside-diphosphate-sugar epimerase
MRLLMLGGTGFLGGAVVRESLRREWTVAVLNRGERGPAPDGVTALRGDRLAPDGLAALDGAGTWDLVVDTWSGEARAALASASALADRAGHYTYVSSRSVYAPPVTLGADETAPIVDAAPDGGPDGYAEMKAGAERAVREAFGDDRVTIARAGLILGPGEDVGRLPWWLRRIERGGDVLAPGPADLPLQYIDARDLAAWLLDAPSGVFNTVSRTGHATMGELLDAAVATVGSAARLVWTDPEPILAAGVEPWNDLPIWIPAGHEYRWLHESDVRHAYRTGLSPRPIAETVADTWEWLRRSGDPAVRPGRPAVGLDPDREAAVLAVSSRGPGG